MLSQGRSDRGRQSLAHGRCDLSFLPFILRLGYLPRGRCGALLPVIVCDVAAGPPRADDGGGGGDQGRILGRLDRIATCVDAPVDQ